jgi:hypothetical protein
MGPETNISAHQMDGGGSPQFRAVRFLPPVLPPGFATGRAGGLDQAAICAGTGWRSCIQSAAFCAWAAAVKIARLSFFSTFSQLET